MVYDGEFDEWFLTAGDTRYKSRYTYFGAYASVAYVPRRVARYIEYSERRCVDTVLECWALGRRRRGRGNGGAQVATVAGQRGAYKFGAAVRCKNIAMRRRIASVRLSTTT